MTPRALPAALVTALTLAAGLLAAQTSYIWQPATIPGCAAGTTITSTAGSDWFSSRACVDAELSAAGDLVTLTSATALAGQEIRSVASDLDAGVALGGGGDYGYLSFGVTGTAAGLLDASRTAEAIVLLDHGGYEQIVRVDLLPDEASCPQLVRGDARLHLIEVSFALDSTAAANSATLGFDFGFVVQGGASVVDEVFVPQSDFDGAEYQHVLPAGTVQVYPRGGDFFIGLAENQPTAQRINVTKTGGAVVVAGFAEVVVQNSLTTREPHDVTLAFDSVDVCLGDSEFIVRGKGASLALNGSRVEYGDALACLGAQSGGRIVIAEGVSQRLGTARGIGMHLWGDESVVEVREDAHLDISSTFFMENYAHDAYIDVLPGASVVVGAEASVQSGGRPGSIRVRLHEGARFDYSAARHSVRELFAVEAVSAAAPEMPAGTFTIAPNPVESGSDVAYVRPGTDAGDLRLIEVFDATGRLAAQQTVAGGQSRYAVALGGATGVFAVRLTDAAGRVGHLRLVKQ